MTSGSRRILEWNAPRRSPRRASGLVRREAHDDGRRARVDADDRAEALERCADGRLADALADGVPLGSNLQLLSGATSDSEEPPRFLRVSFSR